MNVAFYNCKDDPRTLNKDPELIAEKTCTVYGNCSLARPALLLKYDAVVATCNYMYIRDWNRYYFISDVSVDQGKQMIVTASLDAVYTYRNEILECNATCVRNEGIGAPTYVPDNSFPLMPSGEFVQSVIIGKYFDPEDITDNFLLTTK